MTRLTFTAALLLATMTSAGAPLAAPIASTQPHATANISGVSLDAEALGPFPFACWGGRRCM